MNKNIRLLSILEQLSKHHKVCVKELALFLGESQRNIQNDFKDVFTLYFGKRLIKKGDCYSLLNREQFYDLFRHNHKISKQFLTFLSVVDSDLYENFKAENSELLKALKLDSSSVYQIENSSYEQLKPKSLEILEALESAIINRTNITLTHHKPHEEVYVFKECHVLKILYLEDNWYITVNTMQNYHKSNPKSCFRLMRISFIEKITKSRSEPKTFHSDNREKIKAEKFMHLLQTPFSKIHNPPYPVIVEVSDYALVYFKSKQYLPTQRIFKNSDNSHTYIEFTVTDDMEVMLLIQQWIPHLKVIEPLRIKEKISEKMRLFIKED